MLIEVMNRTHLQQFIYFLAPLFLTASSFSFAQDPINEKEVRSLIKVSLSKNRNLADEASERLRSLDVRAIPVLLKIVKKGRPCEQMRAAEVIQEFDEGNTDIVRPLVTVVTGLSFRSIFDEEEMLCRRGAAFRLTSSSEGIIELTKMLKNSDSFVKRSAIFAFDDLTETANYRKGTLPAMKEAIPVIAQALTSKDEVMQRMSNEVLAQMVRQGPKELAEIAQKYVQWN
jgi:hypothetical protein